MSQIPSVEDRLRNMYDAIAEHTRVSPTPVASLVDDEWSVMHPRRPRRRLRVLVPVTAGAAVVAVVTGLVATRSPSRIDVRTPVGAAASSAPNESVPRPITGTEQTLEPADIPPAFRRYDSWKHVPGTSLKAFSVDGSPAFAVGDFILTVTNEGVSTPTPGTCMFWEAGARGGAGCGTLEAIASNWRLSAGVFPDGQTPGPALAYWTHLPVGTAFVTLSAHGLPSLWERPIAGNAAFIVDLSANSTPDRLLRAYDADGKLIVEADTADGRAVTCVDVPAAGALHELHCPAG